MKGNFYIIPGWCDTTGRAPYQRLCEIAKLKGYHVVKINPEWDESLSSQVFPVKKNAVIFGFSMGAILACMIGQKYPCKKIILASMTPVLDLSEPTLNMLGKNINKDLKKFRYGGLKATYFYGEKELDRSLDRIKRFGIKIVPNTCHQLNSDYISRISREF